VVPGPKGPKRSAKKQWPGSGAKMEQQSRPTPLHNSKRGGIEVSDKRRKMPISDQGRAGKKKAREDYRKRGLLVRELRLKETKVPSE